MKAPKNLGMFLLAIWLIIYGVLPYLLFPGIAALAHVLPLLAIAAGILLLLGR